MSFYSIYLCRELQNNILNDFGKNSFYEIIEITLTISLVSFHL